MLPRLSKLYQWPLDKIDGLLDSLTSYKLMLYYLLALAAWATLISFGHNNLPFSWHALVVSLLLLLVVCRAAGELFARVLNIARNSESDYITALILGLIMSPATDAKGYAVLVGAGFAAIASKYLITLNRRHIFNPAAFGAAVAGIGFHHYASWWVGTKALLPLVLVGGILVMRKMKRFYMVASFFLVFILFLHQQFNSGPNWHIIWLAASGTAVLFFGYVMLLEPLTAPDRLRNYLLYSVVVGVCYSYTRLKLSPEEALLIGNALAYALERGKVLELKLAGVRKEAEGFYSFMFSHQGTFNYQAGQFMEWTLPLRKTDSRGNRRYLTLSSAPSEDLLAFTLRLPAKASQFKQTLAKFKPGDKVLASHLGGSFLLPANRGQMLALIAGGIGVTPFRSMAKQAIDKNDQRDVSLLYCANANNEFAFRDLFTQAKAVGWNSSYLDTSAAPISAGIIAKYLPDYQKRLFYLSGPYGFVKATRQALLSLGVPLAKIHSDYFPGYG